MPAPGPVRLTANVYLDPGNAPKPAPAYCTAPGSSALGGETACTPPQAGHPWTKVRSSNPSPHSWQVTCNAPPGSAEPATCPPWAASTNSTSSLPVA
ncbi:hypothetical protein GPEL0_01r2909 [Geoanaerobacter pelophilus]|uniref:Uncharacterized protein n=1 Tax=Geoanaerobacter pelophilus TaxID=60036 RepID=A0ABQ0MJD9_9BACT|nr:hypothetical protein GPEL0_01r2909 [Geoanaerobacter pelophilus]